MSVRSRSHRICTRRLRPAGILWATVLLLANASAFAAGPDFEQVFEGFDVIGTLPSAWTHEFEEDSFSGDPTTVPEPTTAVLMMLGLGGLGAGARRWR